MGRTLGAGVLGWILVAVVLSADIETTVLDVAVSGRCERAGVVQLRLTGDDFAEAAPDAPIYLQIAFDHGARLRQTLVDPLRGETPIAVPVTLVRTGDAEGRLNLAPNAIEVVRWRAGEPELWLAIRQPTSTWVTTSAGPRAPSPELAVVLAVGRSHAATAALADAADARVWPRQNGVAVALDVTLDLSASSLMAAPAPPELSLLNTDVQWYDATTSGVESAADAADIQLGEPLAVLFGVDHPIARAVTAPAADLVVWGTVPKWDGAQTRRPLTALTVAVQSDLFAEANPQQPLYLRLQLPADARLAHTRVAAGSEHMPVLVPLWLPLGAENAPVLNAAADALQIVRYQAGEDAVWLRINQSSDQWLRDGAGFLSPSPAQPVYFQLGYAAAPARARLEALYAAAHANLPAPCRARDVDDPSAAVSTLLVAELAAVVEAQDAAFTWTVYDASTADVTVAESVAAIQLGQSKAVTVAGDTRSAFLTPANAETAPLLTGDLAFIDDQKETAALGRLGLRFEGNWLADAPSSWTLRLPDGVVLRETLVAPGDAGLAITPAVAADADCGLQVVAGASAARITRWVAGESLITLAFAEPTATWLRQAGDLRAPDQTDPVWLWLGESEAEARTRREARWGYCGQDTRAKRALSFPLQITLDAELLGRDTYLAVELLDPAGFSRARFDLAYRDEVPGLTARD